MHFYGIGNLLHLCEKSAVHHALLNRSQIDLTGIRQPVNDQILDSSLPIAEYARYFTNYAWAAVEKKGKLMNIFLCMIEHDINVLRICCSGSIETGLAFLCCYVRVQATLPDTV